MNLSGVKITHYNLSKLLISKLKRKIEYLRRVCVDADPTERLIEESTNYIRKMMKTAYIAGYNQCLEEFGIKSKKLRTDVDEVYSFEWRDEAEQVVLVPIDSAIDRVQRKSHVAFSPTMMREIDVTLTNQDLVYLRDDFTCIYCGQEGDTIDHIHPKSKGGARNDLENMACACNKCNYAKLDKVLDYDPLEEKHNG